MTHLVIVTACRYVLDEDGVHWAVGAFDYGLIRRYGTVAARISIVARVTRGGSRVGISSAGDGPGVVFAPPIAAGSRAYGPIRRYLWTWRRLGEADACVIRVPSTDAPVVWLLSRLRRTPIVVEVLADTEASFANHGSRLGRILAPVFETAMRALINRSDFAIFVSDYLAGRYPSSGQRTVASDAWLSRPQQIRCGSRHLGHTLRIGSVGQVDSAVKGFDMLIQGVAECAVGRSLELRILGRGDPSTLRDLALSLGVADAVHFEGTVPSGESVREWLRSLDVYVQASRSEGLGRAVLEAMSEGLPVVAASVGALPELVAESALYPVDNPHELALLLERIATDGAWVQDLRSHSLRVAASHSEDMMRPLWEATLLEAVGARDDT